MKRAFLIKGQKENYCTSICSECGKSIYFRHTDYLQRMCYLSDKKAEQIHRKHKLINPYESIKKEDILYYTLTKKDHIFEVHIHDYEKELHMFHFDKNGLIEQDDDTLYYLDLIKENYPYEFYKYKKHFLSISEDDCFLIHEEFPMSYQYENLSTFLDDLKFKRFKEKEIDISKLNKIPSRKVDLNVGKKYDDKEVSLFLLKEYEIDKDVVFEVIAVLGEVKKGRIEEPEKYRFFISKDFIYNPKKYDLSKIIGRKDLVFIQEKTTYDKFQKCYPDVKLKEFLESGGKDIVRFILSNNNDRVFELLGKAGLGLIDENIEAMDINWHGKNVKEIFGFPIKVLRVLNNEYGIPLLKKMKENHLRDLYKVCPSIFQEKITSVGYKFMGDFNNSYLNYMTQNLIKHFRYSNQLSNEHMLQLYVDYLRMCYNYKLYPSGKFPDNLKEAHDVMIMYQLQKQESQKAVDFKNAISYPNYRKLEDEVDGYKFLLPREADDLVAESYQMRNCVRSYVSDVARGRTYIIFMRKKNKLSTSFVTIEVTPFYKLRQVKGKGNSEISVETAKIVEKWCRNKGIDSDCYDMEMLERN